MKRYGKKYYIKKVEVLWIIIGGGIFVLGNPFLIINLSKLIDSHLHLYSSKPHFYLWFYIPFFLTITGLSLIIWSVWYQLKIGKGTPVPLAPTQKLITIGPYKYCRNPMVLGTIIYYLGVALFKFSLSALFLVILYSALFVLYIKIIEEKELEAKFGDEYKTYKRNTPFIIPKF